MKKNAVFVTFMALGLLSSGAYSDSKTDCDCEGLEAEAASALQADEDDCDAAGLTTKIRIFASDIEILKPNDKVHYKKNGNMDVGKYKSDDAVCIEMINGEYAVEGSIEVKVKESNGQAVYCTHEFIYSSGSVADKEIWFVNHGTSQECDDHKKQPNDDHSHAPDGNFHGGQAHGNDN